MFKGPLSKQHQKIKCLFLDYVQLLMSQAIWAKTVDRNAKKWKGPLSHRKIKCFIFGLRSTSDDRPSNLSKKCWTKHKKMKMPPKSSKNKMFVFGLHSTSEDWPNDLSKKCWPKCKKNEKGPLSHQKIKCLFLDYVQLLMIGWDLRLTKMQKNEKGPLSHWKIKCLFLDLLTSDDRPSDLSKKCWPKQKNEKGPLSHRKIKCLFLDYVQLLMISRAIWAKNVDQKA